jgi:uncharacterized protein YndB with AHSA1/START domain
MNARATGQATQRDGTPAVAFERSFRAPIEDVWAAVTESDRLARWIGTWVGDPASGAVTFRMNAEGDDDTEARYEVLACQAPALLRVRTSDDHGTWDLTLELSEAAGLTTLRLLQRIEDDPGTVADVGPGWDYYLDRLVAAETGGDVAAIDFERDYHPALRPHYLALSEQLG